MKRVLVTGAYGFLGRHTAALFSKNGWAVIGLGHGHWGFERPGDYGIDEWIEADADQAGLSHVHGRVDCVVHCAGGSSVGHSVKHPLREFQRTVNSTIHVLEFLRSRHPGSALLYPSSAAVYGDHADAPISETDTLAPVSPYGFYKKIVEDLCESYARHFSLPVVVIRFFSIYGAGLQKQLLWDACTKLCSGEKRVSFYGTGEETRDWLHVNDAAELMYMLAGTQKGFSVVNGGSGTRRTVSEILSMLSMELESPAEILMGNESKPGDPQHYWADISKARQLGWVPRWTIEDGLREYVEWFMRQKND